MKSIDEKTVEKTYKFFFKRISNDMILLYERFNFFLSSQ